MAIIALPSEAKIRRVEWTFDRPSQVNRSDWTKKRQVVLQPGKSLWSATCDLVVKRGEVNMLAVEAFLINLDGPINSFRLPASENDQVAQAFTPVVDGAGPWIGTLALRGGVAGAGLRVGHKIRVNDQMVMLMAPLTFDQNGKAVASFKPALRLSPADNTAVEIRRPTVLVSLAGSSVGWSVEPGQQYQTKQLVLEEAF